jgi:hypothetical protein
VFDLLLERQPIALDQLVECGFFWFVTLVNLSTRFKGSSPSWEAESIHKTLIPLPSEGENKSREEKVQKLQLHISNLPDMQMMT